MPRIKVGSQPWLIVGSLVVAALAMSHWSCEVPPLMAPGSSITLIANPTFIPANGGVSVITAIVTEPAGTFVPDGSVVLFFTDLGRVDPQGKTVNGVARVNLVSDSRSGVANVTGVASGTVSAPAPTTTATATPAAIAIATASAFGSGGGAVSGPRAVSAGSSEPGSTSIPVVIGSALPKTVIVTANPTNVVAGGEVVITATVFDTFGNPVTNVPVIFALRGNVLPNERLDSGGAQRFTDTNGQAFDSIRTRVSTAGRGASRNLTVAVNVPQVGEETVSFTVTQ